MLLVKVGGGENINFASLAKDISSISEKVIIVHGANGIRARIAEKMGVKIQVVTSDSGVSSTITTGEIIDLMLMTYSGLANKKLVAELQREGISAIGLSGIDGGLIKGRRNPYIKATVNGKRKVIRDQSGKPNELNIDLLETLVTKGYTPVITVPIIDEDGNILNTDNDEIVALLAREMSIDRAIFLIEESGVIVDGKKIDSLSEEDVNSLMRKERGRFQRKLIAIKKILSGGVKEVFVGDGRVGTPVTSLLEYSSGTVITTQR